MSNLNGLFRQFVSTIANNAGGFVDAFDDSKDGIVLKAEFQANMSQNKADWVNNWNGEASKYNDLIDSFWSSFDNIYKKGEIYDTNIQNAYALDKTESDKVQNQMNVFSNVNELFDKALKGELEFLTKYPEISNYIKGEVANHIIDNNIDDAENLDSDDLSTLINNVINSNADSIKNILLQDLLKNGSLNLNYTAVDGYNPLNDANLMTRINSSITGFSGGIEGLKDYLSEGLNNEINNIKQIAEEYLSDDAKLDVDNNYQIARLAAIYLKTAESMIPADLDEQQREKALARAKESAMNGAKELLGKQGYEDYTIAGACSNATSFYTGLYSCKFLATSAFSKFKDYISALSLSVNVDGGLNYALIEALKENDYSEEEAQAIVQCLVDNGKDIPEYVALVESIAEQVYTSTEQPVDYYALITDAIVNGNMGTSTTSWLSYLEKEAGITKATDSTPGGNNPGGAGGDEGEPLNFMNVDDVEIEVLVVSDTNIQVAKQNMITEINRALEDTMKDLAGKGYDSSILESIKADLKDYFGAISDLTKTLDDSNILSCEKKQDSSDSIKYYFSVNKERLKLEIIDRYNLKLVENNQNSEHLNFDTMGGVRYQCNDGKNLSIRDILNDTGTIGGHLLSTFTSSFPQAIENAKSEITNICNNIKTILLENNIHESKIEWAITTTINYYHAAIDTLYTPGTTAQVNRTINYVDANGDFQSEESNWGCFYGEWQSDINIPTGIGMKQQIEGTGLRLEVANNSDNPYVIGVNISALFKNIQRFLNMAP